MRWWWKGKMREWFQLAARERSIMNPLRASAFPARCEPPAPPPQLYVHCCCCCCSGDDGAAGDGAPGDGASPAHSHICQDWKATDCAHYINRHSLTSPASAAQVCMCVRGANWWQVEAYPCVFLWCWCVWGIMFHSFIIWLFSFDLIDHLISCGWIVITIIAGSSINLFFSSFLISCNPFKVISFLFFIVMPHKTCLLSFHTHPSLSRRKRGHHCAFLIVQ